MSRPDSSFVGRARELARIVQAAERAPVVLIYGLAGIGKTELACRAIAEIRSKPGWLDAPVTMLRVGPGCDDVGAWLASRLGLDELPGTDASHRGWLERLGKDRRIVLLDDAHLAAEPVASLVDEVMRNSPECLFVVASRVELDIQTAPVVVRLGPLAEAECRELVAFLSERLDLEQVDREAIVRASHGSPFRVRAHFGSWSAARQRAADPLRDSIAALPAEDRGALTQVVAIASCPIGQSVIASVVAPPILDRLRSRFLIAQDSGNVIVYDLVRDVVTAMCSEAELVAARREAARAAREAFARDPDPVRALGAICLSTNAGDHDVAMRMLTETYPSIAAASLDHLLLPSLAVLASERSHEAFLLRVRVLLRMARIDEAHDLLAAHAGDRELTRRWQFHAFRGIAAQRRGELGAARAHFAAARQHAPPGRLRARMSIHVADVLSLGGACDEARALLAELESEASLTESDLARIRWSEALSYALEQRFGSVLERVAAGLELAERAGVVDLIGQLALLQVIAACETGALTTARQVLTQLARSPAGCGPRPEVVQFLRGITELAAGNAGEATGKLSVAYDFFRRHRDEVMSCLAGHYLGRAMLAAGDARSAHELLTETASRAEIAGLAALVATGRVYAARAAISHGSVSEAIGAVRRFRDHPWHFVRAMVLVIEAYGAVLGGDVLAARALAHRALEEAGDREPLRTDLCVDMADIETFGGDPESALRTARAALAREAGFGRRYQEARALVAIAAALIARRSEPDLALARRHLDELDALCGDFKLGYLQVRTRFLRKVLEGDAPPRDRSSSELPIAAEAMPGVTAHLRFLGVLAPRYWIACPDGGYFGGEHSLARVRAASDLVIDTTSNVISSRHSRREIRNRSAAVDLVRWLAERRGPASAEELYRGVWGAAEYHPLRHRNTLYIALNRARRALNELVPGRAVIVRVREGWQIASDLVICIVTDVAVTEPTRLPDSRTPGAGPPASSADAHVTSSPDGADRR